MGDDRDSLRYHTTAPTAPPVSAGARAERVLVVYAPEDRDVGASRVLGREAIPIGRGPEGASALVLYDSEASRLHASLERDESGVLQLVDRGSRNGTFVDGARIDRGVLGDGSIARIGSHVLLCQSIPYESIDRLFGARAQDGPIVGRSAAAIDVSARIDEAAKTRSPVIVLGETGVGKELVASEIHRRSGRSGALVPVNCAALPELLAESELFGHARGAFTGATAPSEGLFGAANRGTIFLDEIGDMPLALQAKLLRALESGEVRGVGDTRSRIVDVRVVAATHVDLDEAVRQGRFRGDLYARLMGTTIHVPPLRARREDVLPLAIALMARSAGSEEGHRRTIAKTFSADAAEALLLHGWPFNVRELAQLAQRIAATLGPRDRVELAHLPEALRAPIERRAPKGEARESKEPAIDLTVRPGGAPSADELRQVAERFRGNVSRIAAFFGKERRQVYRWAEKLGVDLGQHREDE